MLVKVLFGKSIDQLKENDIITFFARHQKENDKLEFKSFKTSNTGDQRGQDRKGKDILHKIICTISAFLNTDGGVLIWGAPEESADSEKGKIFSGKLAPVPTSYEKDQLINIIISTINPTPTRISFSAVPIAEGGFVYIFEVAASDFGPHQVRGTYYMRLDGQTKYAPHQYVDALIKKIKVPRLTMDFHFGNIDRINDLIYLCFTIGIANRSQFINERNVYLKLDTFACILKEGDDFQDPDIETHINYKISDTLYYGKPVTFYFTLVSTLYRGTGKRRIPISAELLGDQSPIIHSHYEIEIEFTKSLQPKYTLLSMQENQYLTEIIEEDMIRYNEARADFFSYDFRRSSTFKRLEKWNPSDVDTPKNIG